MELHTAMSFVTIKMSSWKICFAEMVCKTDPTGSDRSRERDQGYALTGICTLNRFSVDSSECDLSSPLQEALRGLLSGTDGSRGKTINALN